MQTSVAVVLLLALTACGSSLEPAPADGAVIEAGPLRPPPASSAASPPPQAPAVDLADGEPLREGRVSFEGMVTPTKGGHSIRGAVFDAAMVPDAIARSGGKIPSDEALLGARVRVTATLERHEEPPPRADGLVAQRRSGGGLSGVAVESAAIVAPPVVVEGKLLRSKGLFQIGAHLVSRSDLGWALAPEGGKEGDRVRLFGQPRVYRCAPEEQCLEGGSIPFFDVGRAERIP